MKKLLLLCTLALAVAAITSCNGGAVNDNMPTIKLIMA